MKNIFVPIIIISIHSRFAGLGAEGNSQEEEENTVLLPALWLQIICTHFLSPP
jgi:hypothetical protein